MTAIQSPFAGTPAPAWLSGLLLPTGAFTETFPRAVSTQILALSSNTVTFTAIPLLKGTVVTNIGLITGNSTISGGTHGWYALCDTTGTVLAVSADTLTGPWVATATAYPLAMGTPYTIPTTGMYYVAVSIVATGMPNFIGSGGILQAIKPAPILSGIGGSQSTPPALSASLGVPTASSNVFYAYVS